MKKEHGRLTGSDSRECRFRFPNEDTVKADVAVTMRGILPRTDTANIFASPLAARLIVYPGHIKARTRKQRGERLFGQNALTAVV